MKLCNKCRFTFSNWNIISKKSLNFVLLLLDFELNNRFSNWTNKQPNTKSTSAMSRMQPTLILIPVNALPPARSISAAGFPMRLCDFKKFEEQKNVSFNSRFQKENQRNSWGISYNCQRKKLPLEKNEKQWERTPLWNRWITNLDIKMRWDAVCYLQNLDWS